jgi:hypothetical protein
MAAAEDAERNDEDASVAIPTGAEGPTVLPDEMASPARLVGLLAPTGQRKVAPGGMIPLPFLGPDGQPYTVQNTPPPPGIVRLPFPDAVGNPLEIVVPPSPPGVIQLPFPAPDGKPYTVPRLPTAPPSSRIPSPGTKGGSGRP